MNAITSENWTYLYYNKSKLKAYISVGADAKDNSSDFILTYFVTVTDEYGVDSSQVPFPDLPKAVENLHQRFANWTLIDSRKSSGGCCQENSGQCCQGS